jgi:hypothetical protein
MITSFTCRPTKEAHTTIKIYAETELFKKYAEVIKKSGRTSDDVFREAMLREMELSPQSESGKDCPSQSLDKVPQMPGVSDR